MKKFAAEFSLVLVALCYAFAVGLYSLPVSANAGPLRAAGKEQLQSSTFSAGNGYAVITTQRVQLTPAETGTVLKSNLPGVDSSATHLLSAVTGSQLHYLLFSKTIRTGLPRTKLIFPFHYFW